MYRLVCATLGSGCCSHLAQVVELAEGGGDLLVVSVRIGLGEAGRDGLSEGEGVRWLVRGPGPTLIWPGSDPYGPALALMWAGPDPNEATRLREARHARRHAL
eukprot:3472648-Prymnesium_polylepis.1